MFDITKVWKENSTEPFNLRGVLLMLACRAVR